jgi:pimeloyl-ACP methyl ester carboxylesterase
MSVTSKVVLVGNESVHYLEAGVPDAAAVIFLHGGLGDAAFHWKRLIPELEGSYRLIAPDLPGFGKSDPLSDMSYESLVTWLKGFYAALQIEHAVLIGHSVGALIARLFAAKYAYAVPALVLINGGILPGKPSGAAKVLSGIPGVNNMMFSMFSRQGVSSRQALDWVVSDPNDETVLTKEMVESAKNSASGLARLMKAQAQSTVPTDRVPPVPTLLLWGVDDTIAPLSAGERVQKAIPGSELRQVEGCKHAPHIEATDVVSFQILYFVDNLGRPTKSKLPGAGKLDSDNAGEGTTADET